MAPKREIASWRKAVAGVKDGSMTVDAAIAFIRANYHTPQSINWAIATFKSKLKQEGHSDAAEKVAKSKEVEDIIEASNVEQENRRLAKADEPFYVDPIFARSKVIDRLNGYLRAGVKRDSISLPFFCDMLICFAARPHELFTLKISDNGYVSGFGKNPGNYPRKFVGLLPVDDCRTLLGLIQGTYDRSLLYKPVYDHYNMQLKQFRPLGAMYIAAGETNLGKQRMMIQQALRHKTPATSLMYYDIARVTHDVAYKMKQIHAPRHKKVVGSGYNDSSDSSD